MTWRKMRTEPVFIVRGATELTTGFSRHGSIAPSSLRRSGPKQRRKHDVAAEEMKIAPRDTRDDAPRKIAAVENVLIIPPGTTVRY
jgi:hypothetical protein